MNIKQKIELRKKKRRQRRRLILLLVAVVAAVIYALFAALGNDEPASAPEPSPTPTSAVEAAEPTAKPQSVEEFIAAMSVDEKIMQLFVLDIDTLTGVENTTLHGNTSKKAITEKPVGGILYDGGNIESKPQTASMLSNLQAQYREENGFCAFLAISEEGGDASPAASAGFGAKVKPISAFAQSEDYDGAYQAGATVGKYLSSSGFNVNLAPDCTIAEGLDAETMSSLAVSFGDGVSANGVKSVYKAFPGKVVSGSTIESMEAKELLPFVCAINGGAEMVMVSTGAAPVITGDSTPCALSKAAVTDYLRTKMSFDGVVVTEALAKEPDDAALRALEAGCDLMLLPKDFTASVQAIKVALTEGRITEERINESLRRILSLKLGM